jgi:hypothetical protein
MLCDEIIQNIIDYCDIQTLFSFIVNRKFTNYINGKDWKKYWLEICKHKPSANTELEKKITDTMDNEYKMVVKLAGFQGCMICNKKNIRKVWWEFNIRSCMNCIKTKTIGEWEFEKKIPKETYSHLPYTTKEMYNRYFRNYVIKFYWKKSINELLLLHPPKPPVLVLLKNTMKPTKLPKIKKIPSELEIEKQKQRKIDIDNICLSNDISLEDAATMSNTYKENIIKMSKLQNKNFIDTKIPIIKQEIEEEKAKEREHMEYLRNLELERMKRTVEILEKQKIQSECRFMYKEDKKKDGVKNIPNIVTNIKKKQNMLTVHVKNVRCELCENNNRQFSLVGLRDHQRDVHNVVNNLV